MASVSLGFAPLHPPFAQVLLRYMSACSGISYSSLHASYLACEKPQQYTLGGAFGRWRSPSLAKNGLIVIKLVEIGPKNHEKYFFV
jgi:hypothetical protein